MHVNDMLKKIQRLGDASNHPRHIAIIGAGVAGLAAAYELTKYGHHVTVYEGSGRIGGRILTTHYGKEHAELGAMRIPETHDDTLHYCKVDDKLSLGRFINEHPNAYYDIRNTKVRYSNGGELASLFDLSPQDHKAASRDINAIIESVLQDLLRPITPKYMDAFHTGQFSDASLATKLDGTSIRQFLEQRLANRGALELVAAVNYMRDLWHGSNTGLIRTIHGKRQTNLLSRIPAQEYCSPPTPGGPMQGAWVAWIPSVESM